METPTMTSTANSRTNTFALLDGARTADVFSDRLGEPFSPIPFGLRQATTHLPIQKTLGIGPGYWPIIAIRAMRTLLRDNSYKQPCCVPADLRIPPRSQIHGETNGSSQAHC